MPTIPFEGRTIECPAGANLRMVMIRARLPLYNRAARALNCRGRGGSFLRAGALGVIAVLAATQLATSQRWYHGQPSHWGTHDEVAVGSGPVGPG